MFFALSLIWRKCRVEGKDHFVWFRHGYPRVNESPARFRCLHGRMLQRSTGPARCRGTVPGMSSAMETRPGKRLRSGGVAVAMRLCTTFLPKRGRLHKRAEPPHHIRRAVDLADHEFETRRKPRHVRGALPFGQVPRAGGVVLDRGERFAQFLQQREAIRREKLIVVRRQGGQGHSFQRCGGAIVPSESVQGAERGADGRGPPVIAALWLSADVRRHGDAPRCPDPPSPLRALCFGPATMACRRQLRQINATPFLLVHASKGWQHVL